MTARFNKEWMGRVEYKDWLLSEPSDNTKAKCRFRKRSFSLSNMGDPAIKSHAQGKKHQNAVKETGKSTSVLGFLKKEGGASTSKQSEELSACKESEELSAAVTRSNEEQKSSRMARFALTKGNTRQKLCGH